jgi:hypothetical protein
MKLTYDGKTLTIEGATAEDAVAIMRAMQPAAEAAAEPAPKKPRAPKPPSKPEPASASTAPPNPAAAATNGAANGKLHHLPTPAELRAKKAEEEEEEERQEATAPVEDEEEEEEEIEFKSEVANGDGAKPAEPFVEDLDIHQVVDQAARVKGGKEAVPEPLMAAKALKDVIRYLSADRGLRTQAEMLEACESWRESVPVLARIDAKDFKRRVSGAADLMGFPA